MDPRLLPLYVQELQHVREGAHEFAQRFPQLASHLALDSTAVKDPFVERLLEGFAFIAARIQLRLDEEFPRLCEQLLEQLCPSYLAPFPSAGVIEVEISDQDPRMLGGILIERHSLFTVQAPNSGERPCRFSAVQRQILWPFKVIAVTHGPLLPSMQATLRESKTTPKSALCIRFEVLPYARKTALPVDELSLFCAGEGELPGRLHDRLCLETRRILWRRSGEQDRWQVLSHALIQPMGYCDEESVLPETVHNVSAHRLLMEWLAFGRRFHFLGVKGIAAAFQTPSEWVELAFVFDQPSPVLDQEVSSANLVLNCVPVVNLFTHRCDRTPLALDQHHTLVVPDRTHVADHEIWSVQSVQAHGLNTQMILPSLVQRSQTSDDLAVFYTTRRIPYSRPAHAAGLDSAGSNARAVGEYTGTHHALSLSVPHQIAVQQYDIQQLTVTAWCTDVDRPVRLPLRVLNSALKGPADLPEHRAQFVYGPTKPIAPRTLGPAAWSLVSLIQQRWLGFGQGELLSSLQRLFNVFESGPVGPDSAWAKRLLSAEAQPVARTVIRKQRPALLKGWLIRLTLDDQAMPEHGLGSFGRVLTEVIAREIQFNSFVELDIHAQPSGRMLKISPQIGTRPGL